MIKRIKICEYCKKEFDAGYHKEKRFCNLSCSRSLLNKKRIGYKMSDEHKAKIGKANSKKMKELWKDEEYVRHMSDAHKWFTPINGFKKGNVPFNKGKRHLGDEKHPLWKGDDAGYNSIHFWIRKKKGKPIKCEICGKKNCKFHLANLDHKYKRKVEDYKYMCVSCHSKYDFYHNQNGKRGFCISKHR